MSVHGPASSNLEFDQDLAFGTPNDRLASDGITIPTDKVAKGGGRAAQLDPGSGPRYLAIAKLIEREIIDGVYNVGEMLPTEAQLVRRFGVSRFTVREALRLLEATALVRRKQGAGTIVESTEPTERFTQRLQSLRQVLQYPHSRLEVDRVHKVRLSRADAQLLDVEAGETWMKATGKRRATGSGKLVCTTTIWLRQAFAGALEQGSTIDGSVHTRLEQRFGVRIERVDVALNATVLTDSEAGVLGRASRTAGMLVARRYSDMRGATLQVSRDCHPADAFSYRVQFQRERTPE